MELKNWPIFHFLRLTCSEINESKIYKVLVYGDGGTEGLIVTQDKMVFAIGTNKSSCLGIGHKRAVFKPTVVQSLCGKDIKTFAYGKGPHVLALTCAGEVYSWGHNVYSELGNICSDSICESSIPEIVPILPDNKICIVDVACGAYHSLALSDNGEVYVWGNNDHGQAGANLSKYKIQRSPMKVNFLSDQNKVVCISCGLSSNAVVTNNGDVYTWGDNSMGQLGIGEIYQDCPIPCKVVCPRNARIKKVTCGPWHTLALSEDFDVFIWGFVHKTELDVSECTIWTPVEMTRSAIIRVLDIASTHSTEISVFRGTNNQIFVWGNCLGQLIKTPMPVSVSCIHDAFAIYTSTRVMHKPLTLHEDDKVGILQSLRNAFNDSSTSDLIIQVQGYLIHVHKCILKIRSHHFKTIFQEKSMKNNQCIIKEDQFSYNIYRTYLKYLYTDEIDNVSPTDVFELLKLANIYSEYHLQRRCTELIVKSMRVSNVASLYGTAIAYNNKTIEESCFKFALRQMTQVIQTPSFAQLNESAVKTFIIKAANADVFKT